ncbi:MAG: hypothetical protein VKK42_15835 [Lyngbya sp.]|nr:hypothetical protein [Lyngbya sp.]
MKMPRQFRLETFILSDDTIYMAIEFSNPSNSYPEYCPLLETENLVNRNGFGDNNGAIAG